MKIGFTGTRAGMTNAQHQKIDKIVWFLRDDYGATVAIEGDCIGADDDFWHLVRFRGLRTETFPPVNRLYRCHHRSDKVHLPAPYMTRNQSIVDNADVMIAAPGEMEWRPHSGTWATITMARKANKHLYIVFPDGSVKEENV